MFENATLFAILKDARGNTEVKRMPLDANALSEVRSDFSRLFLSYETMAKVDFDGNYQINQEDGLNEILSIGNFPSIPNGNGSTESEPNINATILGQVTQAINNSSSVPDFSSGENISSLFIGEITQENNRSHTRIAFQKFKKAQLLVSGKRILIFNGNVYQSAGENGLSIPTEYLTAIYVDGELKFTSPHWTNQIFSLAEYYKEATQEEVNQFAEMPCLSIADKQKFNSNVEVKWYRKRIAFIKNSGILEHYTPSDIQSAGKDLGIEVSIEDNKIVLPDEKQELRKLLAFLAEDTYKGIFTQNIYNTNSKTSSPSST